MKIERLQMSIQTVKENIAILESQKPEEYAMFDKDRYFYYRNYAVEYYAKNGGYRARNGGQFHALTQSYIYNSDLEVIGNIHDNPELMKGATGDAR